MMSEEEFELEEQNEISELSGEDLLKEVDKTLAEAELARIRARQALAQCDASHAKAGRDRAAVSLAAMLLVFGFLGGC